MEGLFEHLQKEGHVVLIPDTKYRDKALQIVNEQISTDKTFSLVDMIIRLMMEDDTLGDVAVYSFNVRDFVGVGYKEVFSPEWNQ